MSHARTRTVVNVVLAGPIIACAACGTKPPSTGTERADSVNRALTFLNTIMDQYHGEYLDVYTDAAAAGNHFAHGAAIYGGIDPAALLTDDAWTEQAYRGGTCIRNFFGGRGAGWGGFYRMNGVLRSDDVSPQDNWGTQSQAGIPLTGATQLEFRARGEQGGEQVEFFAFGVGRDADTGDVMPGIDDPDSSRKLSTEYVTLTTEWTRYTIGLAGADLSYVLGGFGWVTNAQNNGDQDVVCYVDDIRYRLGCPTTLRLLQSYVPHDDDLGSETLLRNLATTYDNALALVAFVALDEVDRAKMLAEAFVYAQNHDRYFEDGRLRNGYQAGDLALPPGWEPHGRVATARIPGWWGSADGGEPQWFEDAGFVGSKVGDLAWAVIALMIYRDAVGLTGDDEYLTAAVRLGEWIEDNCRDTRGLGGYTGGYEAWEPDQVAVGWKATEHNIDTVVAFTHLYLATLDGVWQERAEAARKFVEGMWEPNDGHFWTGTTEDGVTINESVVPLDIQAWAILALGAGSKYDQALSWAEANCAAEDDGYRGFDFNTDLDGVWFEGTAHMALAYRAVGNDLKAEDYLQELRRAQSSAEDGDGLGLLAASRDGLTTGFGTTYARRLHIGATSWLVFAELNYNPYWGAK